MSDKLIETLAEMMGVIAGSRHGNQFLNDQRVGECKIDTSLIEADGTDSMWDSGDDLALVNSWKRRTHLVGG